mmetsp:Transcript_5885/g.16524  ORF Transcript_5885/g.16524 Transcript_5885/m.16524 type:complete len:100 (-) Transcript_5885:1300-1599(-)
MVNGVLDVFKSFIVPSNSLGCGQPKLTAHAGEQPYTQSSIRVTQLDFPNLMHTSAAVCEPDVPEAGIGNVASMPTRNCPEKEGATDPVGLAEGLIVGML